MWLLTLQLFKNSIDTEEKLRLNLHSLSVSELLEYGWKCLRWFQKTLWQKGNLNSIGKDSSIFVSKNIVRYIQILNNSTVI